MCASITLAASSHDRRRALAFVRRHVRQRYGGIIPPPSQIMLFAEQNRRICGTIALDFADGTRRFPLEAIYRIDKARTPWAFEREKIAQFGKWWTTRPGVALYLMQAAHRHALTDGKRFGLVEAKPRIVARVGEFGMALIEVPGAALLIEGATTRGEGYYATLPPPRLYMFDIPANAAALARYIKAQGGC
jgi:hypothetical protein